VFGLGAPLVAMVGTNIGAGRRERALRVAWTGAAIAGVVTAAIGIAGALWPRAWLTLFGDDPTMLAVGAQYLRIVGPFYGFFGVGMALYFASQGAGRLGWPLLAGLLRLAVATLGGWLALRLVGTIEAVFLALGLALALFGLINAAANKRPNRPARIESGVALLKLLTRDGKPVFVVEYLDAPQEIALARKQLEDHGFVPLFADRALDTIRDGDLPAPGRRPGRR
jgi:Na+-driven multidrug efflux pump